MLRRALQRQSRGSATRTNSEGQVKYCRCTIFGPATPDRAGARPASNVESLDVTWAPPTSHPLSRLFACFAGPILQAKRGHLQDYGRDAVLRSSVKNSFFYFSGSKSISLSSIPSSSASTGKDSTAFGSLSRAL